MNYKIIITGIGGQGVVFATRILAQVATSLDQPVMISETHGMSQRGGSVVSHLKIGGEQSPLIHQGTADILIGFNFDETLRQLPFIRPGGVIFNNTDSSLTSKLDLQLKQLEIRVMSISASQIAVDLGSAAVTNVVMTGFALSNPPLEIQFEVIANAIKTISKRSLEINLKALEIGYIKGQAVNSKEKIS